MVDNQVYDLPLPNESPPSHPLLHRNPSAVHVDNSQVLKARKALQRRINDENRSVNLDSSDDESIAFTTSSVDSSSLPPRNPTTLNVTTRKSRRHQGRSRPSHSPHSPHSPQPHPHHPNPKILNNLQQTLHQLKHNLKASEQSNAEKISTISKLEREKLAMTDKITDLRTKLSSTNDRVGQLKAILSQKHNSDEVVQDLERTTSALERRLDNRENEIMALIRENDNLKKNQVSLESAASHSQKMAKVAEENLRFMESRAKAAEDEMRQMAARYNSDLAGVSNKVDEIEATNSYLRGKVFKKKELLQRQKKILMEFQNDRERLLDQLGGLDESSFFAEGQSPLNQLNNEEDSKIPPPQADSPPPVSPRADSPKMEQFKNFQSRRKSVSASQPEPPAPPASQTSQPSSQQKDEFFYRQNKTLKKLLRKIVLGKEDTSEPLYRRARIANADEAMERLVRRTISSQNKVTKKKKKKKKKVPPPNYNGYNYSTTRMRVANARKALGNEQADLLWHILLDEE